jgi:Leucine-rich repeat (LRR) protein
MRFLRQHKFSSLESALIRSEDCETLNLMFIDFNLKNFGSDFLRLKNLKKLYIQGDSSIYEWQDFDLPKEIGQINNLKVLSLLNLPLKTFPIWATKLHNLEYLMVRGTNLTSLPSSISELKNLKTLRVENCPLNKLPIELNQMNKLRHLGFCDTRLKYLSEEFFPTNLKTLNFSGTGCFDKKDLEKIRAIMTNTKVYPI